MGLNVYGRLKRLKEEINGGDFSNVGFDPIKAEIEVQNLPE